MTVLLGTLAAIGWGVGDLLGGIAGRRGSAVANAAVAELSGVAVVAPALLLVHGQPTLADFGWAAAAGAVSGLSLAALFALLARGSMATTAPLTGAVAACTVAGAAILMGEPLRSSTGLGVAAALLAVLLVDVGVPGLRRPDGLHLAVAVGAGLGTYDVLLSRVSTSAGVAPVLAARAAGFTVALGAAAVVGLRVGRLPQPAVGLAAVGGLADAAGAMAFLAAAQVGLLVVAGPVAALYPVVTALLAVTLLAERVTRAQGAGMALAALSLVVLALP